MIGLLFYILLGLVAGVFILGSKPAIVFTIFGGAILLVFFSSKPKIGILAIVFIVSSIIFEEAMPLISIGLGSLHIADIFLLFLFCVIFFKLSTENKFKFVKTPLDLPLVLFYLAAIISAFIAVTVYDVKFNIVMRQFRYLTYYLIIFVVTTFIQEEKEIKFIIKGLFAISCVVGIAMVLQAILGESVHIMPGRVEVTETFGNIYASTRVLPPGQTLIFVMFITGVCSFVLMNKSLVKSGYFYLLLIIGVAVILTYNRSHWMAIAFSLSIFMLLISKEHKKRLIAWLVTMFILTVTIGCLFLGIGGKAKEFTVSVIDRGVSLFAKERLYYSSSLEWRKMENYHAIRNILNHPISGIGLGNNYRSRIASTDDKLNLTGYIHNGYLWILMYMGFLGFTPFMWLCIAFLVRGFLNWRDIKDEFLRAVIIGFTLSYVGIMLSCLVNPTFVEWFSITIIGIMMGINETIIRINRKES
jgi:hypothetical protein